MTSITAIYAGLAALLFVALSLRVSLSRMATRQVMGDGGDSALALRIRQQGNAAEYIPITLILMALAELQGAAGWALHLAGVALILSRLMHAFGMDDRRTNRVRYWGMLLCYALIAALGLANLGLGLW